MGILDILRSNLGRRPRTRKPGDTVPYPDVYRGQLGHETSRCTACGTCAYVCSPSAIVIRQEAGQPVWTYNAGQCTYCGRCAAYCPTGAISLATYPTAVADDLQDFKIAHSVETVPCTRCGKPFIPLPAVMLVKMYGDPLPAEITAARHLCENCRNRIATRNLKEAVRGQLVRRAADLVDRQTIQKGEDV